MAWLAAARVNHRTRKGMMGGDVRKLRMGIVEEVSDALWTEVPDTRLSGGRTRKTHTKKREKKNTR